VHGIEKEKIISGFKKHFVSRHFYNKVAYDNILYNLHSLFCFRFISFRNCRIKAAAKHNLFIGSTNPAQLRATQRGSSGRYTITFFVHLFIGRMFMPTA